MYDASVKETDGCIAEEIKLAIAIRLLAGGDAFDLAVIFDVYYNHCKSFFKKYY